LRRCFMPAKKTLPSLTVILVAIAGFLTAAVPASAADKEKVLYSFIDDGGNGVYEPKAGVIFDAAGNLYSTGVGGLYGGGAVFQLAPGADGTWTETVVYNFCSADNCTDGGVPLAGLISDAAGNLYGTTATGGSYSGCREGCGTVFELTPGTNGTWTENVLHSFGNGADGQAPYASLIFDATGNLYGTTLYGGTYGAGTVFQLTPGAGGAWTENVLRSFGTGKDGYGPYGSVVLDAAGSLYGTTSEGGYRHHPGCGLGCGTAFQLTPGADGKWAFRVLHIFGNGSDGRDPYAGLALDAAGNLYGTTLRGGSDGYGTIFELRRGANGKWTERILRSFGSDASGAGPVASLIFDAAGNLYGTTGEGGRYGWGTAFELGRGTNGKWTYNVLHSFGRFPDGTVPWASLTFDTAGDLFGTTSDGGAYNVGGTVFEIKP
jgi:uncharacterized repeat protein (TIGR03803 family)